MRNEIIEYLRENTKGKSVKELQNMIEKNFNGRITTNHIAYIKNRYGIKSGRIGQFEKGHKPLKHRPIGYEKNINGYVYIKIGEPSIYTSKQRYIYEKMHGKIPEGCIVIFADKNKTNFNPDNLILISKQEFLIMNDNGLYKEDVELTKTGVTLSKIINQLRKLSKKEKKTNDYKFRSGRIHK